MKVLPMALPQVGGWEKQQLGSPGFRSMEHRKGSKKTAGLLGGEEDADQDAQPMLGERGTSSNGLSGFIRRPAQAPPSRGRRPRTDAHEAIMAAFGVPSSTTGPTPVLPLSLRPHRNPRSAATGSRPLSQGQGRGRKKDGISGHSVPLSERWAEAGTARSSHSTTATEPTTLSSAVASQQSMGTHSEPMTALGQVRRLIAQRNVEVVKQLPPVESNGGTSSTSLAVTRPASPLTALRKSSSGSQFISISDLESPRRNSDSIPHSLSGQHRTSESRDSSALGGDHQQDHQGSAYSSFNSVASPQRPAGEGSAHIVHRRVPSKSMRATPPPTLQEALRSLSAPIQPPITTTAMSMAWVGQQPLLAATTSTAGVILSPPMPTGPPQLSDEEIFEMFKKAILQKHGSILAGFQWLDFNKKGRITKLHWLNGLKIMHLDMDTRAMNRLFAQIDKTHGGNITSATWCEFFGVPQERAATPGTLSSARLLRNLSNLAERARRRSTLLLDDMDVAQSSALPDLDKLVAAAEDEDSDPRSPPSNIRALVATDEQNAEAKQIEEDVQQLGLSGIRALAYLLTAKCGSLHAAFHWLDCTCRNQFSRSYWDTAVAVLHIDIEKVTGIRPRDLFRMMSDKGQGSRVTKASWDKFFSEVIDWDLLKGLKAAVQKRARRKLIMNWKWKPPVGVSSIPPARLSSKDSSSKRGSSKEGARVSGAATRHGAGKIAMRKVLNALRVVRHFRPQEEKPVETPRSEAATTVPPSPATSGSSSSSMRLPPPPTNWGMNSRSKSKEPKLADDHDLEAFKESVRKMLDALRPDEGVHFPSLKRLERIAVEGLALERGLWKGAVPSGFLVYKEGPKALELRFRLKDLCSGECVKREHLTTSQALFAQAMATSLGFATTRACNWAGSNGDCNTGDINVNIFNLSGSLNEFADGLRRLLANLRDGEEIDLPSCLSKYQQEVVHMIVEELGLFSLSCPDEEGAMHLVVGNLRGFQHQVRTDLSKLAAGASMSYPGLTALREHIVKEVVSEHFQGFEVNATKQEVNQMLRNVRVTRPATGPAGDADECKSQALDEDEDFCITSNVAQQKIKNLFEIYATGMRGGVRIFLRKTDLRRFMEDARKMHQRKHKMHQKHRKIHASTNVHLTEFEEMAEDLFEQALELQEDLGTRISHGITYDYFQVFIGKSANILGWCLPGFLKAMLESSGRTF